MSKQRNALILVFVSVLFCLELSGCTHNAPYRWKIVDQAKNASLSLKCHENLKDSSCFESIERNENYTLFFVELDEQGRFYDRRQIEALMDFLKKRGKPNENANDTAKCGNGESSFRDMSIVTFVHGWRHNAEYNDTNVVLARQILEFTAMGEKLPPNPNPSGCPRATVGVYLGWRGLSTTAGLNTKKSGSFLSTLLAPWELMSVWDRKNTSQNMAVGSARELFSLLRAFQEDQNNDKTVIDKCSASEDAQTKAGKAPNNAFNIYHCKPVRLLIVGHSFGGLIAYNAVAGQLLDSVTRGALVEPNFDTCQDESAPPATSTRLPPTAMVRSYADLIILINPAVEGARYEPLHQAINYRAKITSGQGAFCPNQRPVMVVITSKYDWATGKTFPGVRFFSTLFESTHPYNPNFNEVERKYVSDEERRTSVNTLGHVERFHTHRLNGAKQIIAHVNEETDSYAKGLRQYCNPDVQPTTEIEKSLKHCRCGDEWNDLPKAKDQNENDLIEKLNSHAQVCRAFIGEKNMADMLAGTNPVWLMPIEVPQGEKFGSRKKEWRQTFCGGATLTHLATYKRSEGLIEQLRVENSVSSPVWNIYAMDDTIIDGHSDIHQGVFKQFLQQLYHILTVRNFSRENFKNFGDNAVKNFNDEYKCTANDLLIPAKQFSHDH